MSFFARKWKLRACREQAGYTQQELAKIMGVCEVTIVNWETGKTSPSMKVAQKLSELYKMPLANIDFSKEGNSKSKRG